MTEGVNLHLINDSRFKTNKIVVRFSAPYQRQTVAQRVLVAQMLATANESYPTNQLFRQKLSSLYGSQLSTTIGSKGLVHYIDIELVFLKDRLTLGEGSLLEQLMFFLKDILRHPLKKVAQYQPDVFEREQQNFAQYLQSDEDDVYYSSQLGLQKDYYEHDSLKQSKYGTVDEVQEVSPISACQEFQRMLSSDVIDIFAVGEFDLDILIHHLHYLNLESRTTSLQFNYSQPYNKVITETLAFRHKEQSVIQLGYQFQVAPSSKDFYVALVVNAMLGSFSNSLLTTYIREQAGLSYTVGSKWDSYTGLMIVYGGIEAKQRNAFMQLTSQQINRLKTGRFSNKLLEQTKTMLVSEQRLLTDNPRYAIEQAYVSHYMNIDRDVDAFVNAIEDITKSDIVRVAKQIRLQGVFFVEGARE